MKYYFVEKDSSIKEYFLEQGLEDYEDLLIDADNFEDLMEKIIGEDND